MFNTDLLPQLLIHFGYVALFAATFLKGFTIVVVAGALAHQGYLSLPMVMVCAFAGSLAGDEVEYYAGRRYGPAFLASCPRLNRISARIHTLLVRYDALFMLGFRFLYGVRIVTPLLLALEGVPPGRFFVFNLVGALVWAVCTSLAGYGLANVADYLTDDGDWPFVLAALMALAAAALMFRFLQRRRISGQAPSESPAK